MSIQRVGFGSLFSDYQRSPLTVVVDDVPRAEGLDSPRLSHPTPGTPVDHVGAKETVAAHGARACGMP